MKVEAIKTRIMNPPQDDLLEVIKESVTEVPEKSILAITSKVVSIWQGKCVPDTEDKDELIQKEADLYIPRNETKNGWVIHTIKNNILMSSAGVDGSNVGDYFVLWPDKPYETARDIRQWLQHTYGVKDIGVVITDSRSMPLRRGTIGMSLGCAGFTPLKDYRGDTDIFDKELVMTMSNIADSVADAATLVMGEGKEMTPLALITDLPDDYFVEWEKVSDKPYSSFEVPQEEDMYFSLMDNGKWKK